MSPGSDRVTTYGKVYVYIYIYIYRECDGHGTICQRLADTVVRSHLAHGHLVHPDKTR